MVGSAFYAERIAVKSDRVKFHADVHILMCGAPESLASAFGWFRNKSHLHVAAYVACRQITEPCSFFGLNQSDAGGSVEAFAICPTAPGFCFPIRGSSVFRLKNVSTIFPVFRDSFLLSGHPRSLS